MVYVRKLVRLKAKLALCNMYCQHQHERFYGNGAVIGSSSLITLKVLQ